MLGIGGIEGKRTCEQWRKVKMYFGGRDVQGVRKVYKRKRDGWYMIG